MKFIPYGHQSIDSADINEVVRVLKSGWITQGPKINEFEKALCRYTGAKYAVAVSSGTAALHLACLAGGIGNGDEVITSPITFVATSNSVLYCGGRPVFADIQNDTVNIDPVEIKKKITRRTKAIIPVHFAGYPCDMDEIHRIAWKNKLLVIEDAAHALGAEYKGSRIGSCRYSDMTTLSFHPVKHITTGEGGAILTNKKELYKRLLMLRTHGITKDKDKLINNDGPWYYEQHALGFNYRITDIQCALGLSQLKKLNGFASKRNKIAAKYGRLLKNIKGISLPVTKNGVKHAWHIYVIRLIPGMFRVSKSEIYGAFIKEGIGVNLHYIPVYLQPYYRKFGYNKSLCPNAERYYIEALTIPLFPGMTEREVNKVAAIVRKVSKIFSR